MKRIIGGATSSLLSTAVYEPPSQQPIAQQSAATPVGFLAEGGDVEIFAQSYDLDASSAFVVQVPQTVGATQKRWRGIDVYVDVGPGGFRGIGVQLFSVTQGVRTLLASTVVVPGSGAGGETGRRVIAFRAKTAEIYQVVLSALVTVGGGSGSSVARIVGVAGNDLEPDVLGDTAIPALMGTGTNVVDGGSAQVPSFTGVGPVLVPGLRLRSVQAFNNNIGAAVAHYLLIGDKPLNPAAGWTDILWAIGLMPGETFQSQVDFLGGYRFAEFPTFWVSTSPTTALGPAASPSIVFSAQLE